MWLFMIMKYLIISLRQHIHIHKFFQENSSRRNHFLLSHICTCVSIINNNIQLKVHLTAYDTPHQWRVGCLIKFKIGFRCMLYLHVNYYAIDVEFGVSMRLFYHKCANYKICNYGWRNELYVRLSAFTDTFQSVLFMLSFYFIFFMLHITFFFFTNANGHTCRNIWRVYPVTTPPRPNVKIFSWTWHNFNSRHFFLFFF